MLPNGASDHFQVRVVDAKTLGNEPTAPLRACVVVEASTYSFAEVRDSIARTIEGCGQRTWLETGVALSRYFRWEYEGYLLKADVDVQPH